MFSLQQVIANRNKRLDGYSSAAASIVCEFQRDIERDIQLALSAGDISYAEYTFHYDALRVALVRSRDRSFVVSYENLLNVYLDSLSIIRQ